MILVTGSTGFIGQRAVARLANAGRPICCLVRPARKERRFPSGVPLRILAGEVDDPPALRAAMQDVRAILHLASLRVEEGQRTFESVNYQGTLNVIEAAQDAGIARLVYVSQIGADAHSAYPFLRSKGQAEGAVAASGLDYTIVRSSLLYGENDEWTTNLAIVLKSVPWIFPVAGDGQARFQPLWVEDLVTCIQRCLDDSSYSGQTLAVGGPEYLTVDQIVDSLAHVLNVRRHKLHLGLPLALWLARVMKHVMRNPLLTQTIVDNLSVNAVTDPGSVTRHFGFAPVRFSEAVTYLRGRPLRREFLRRLIAGA